MSNNYIDDLFDNLRRDPFNNNPTNDTSYELQQDFLSDPQGPEGWIAEGVITDVELVDGSTLVGKVDALPTLPDADYPEGKVVYLTTNGKLYRNDSDVWTSAVPTVDLTGQITETQITDSAITTNKVAANAIVADKIASNAITTDKLNANAVTAAKIAAGTITANEIAANTITAAKIAASTITTTEIAANTITAADIAAGTITATEIAAATITAANMVAGTITAASAIIADAAITGAKIASATITDANISSLSASKITAGTITIAPSSGVSAITSTNFNVSNSGIMSASGGVFDPITTATVQRAALTVKGNATEGDIATTASTNITLGYRTGAGAIGGTFYPILKVINPASGTEGTVAVNGGMTVTDVIQSTNGLAGDNVLQTFVTNDAYNRFKLEQNGAMSWGSGAAAVDSSLTRSSTGEMTLDADLKLNGGGARSLDVKSAIYWGATTYSLGATGLIQAANVNLSGTNGLRHDTPATTSGTGQIAGEAMWVLVSGTNYQLRRSTGTSWARFKDNIQPTSISPEQFAALNFVQFDWNRAALLEQYPDLDSVDASKQHGLLLDQLVDVLPEAVQHPTNSTDTETVNWHAVHIASMVALQDAIKRIAELEERLAALES